MSIPAEDMTRSQALELMQTEISANHMNKAVEFAIIAIALSPLIRSGNQEEPIPE